MKNSFLVNCHLNIAEKFTLKFKRFSFDGLQPFQGSQAELSRQVAAQINRLQLSSSLAAAHVLL
jgi:hypothetical protein